MRSVILLVCAVFACGAEGAEDFDLEQSEDALEAPEPDPGPPSGVGALQDLHSEPGAAEDRSDGSWEEIECGADHQCRTVVYRDGKRLPDHGAHYVDEAEEAAPDTAP